TFHQGWKGLSFPEGFLTIYSILRFDFGRTTPALDRLDALPRRTTLERAIVRHLKAGRHWHGGAGWLRL
ncbi:MAG: hypothetical protein HY332_07400, partial [Chloroflexi bacterium]|nr:hypothetical protein [Chloroflexota bacterium]